MDKEEAITLIRALLSSTSNSYNVRSLLRDFKEEVGIDLPLYGYSSPFDFLRSIPDTVKLVGEHPNQQVCLVISEKSAHVVQLVDNQRNDSRKRSGRSHRRPSRPFGSSRPRKMVFQQREHEKRRDFEDERRRRRREEDRSGRKPAGTPGPAYVSSSDQLKFHKFLKTFPEGAGFGEVDDFVKQNGGWDKFNMQNGVRDLVKYCCLFCSVYNNRVFDNDSLQKYKQNCQFSKDGDFRPADGESSDEESFTSRSSSYESDYYDGCKVDDISNDKKVTGAVESPEKPVFAAVKNRIKILVDSYPEGIWFCDLPELYRKTFNAILDYRDFGCNSLSALLSQMHDFRFDRPGDGDWLLFDGHSTNSSGAFPEFKPFVPNKVKNEIFRLLTSHSSSTGILLDELQYLFFKMYNTRINYKDYGFRDFSEFIYSMENDIYHLRKCEKKVLLVPEMSKSESDSIIVSNGKVFVFPEEVFGPKDRIPNINLKTHVRVGEYVEVIVAEVWHPHKFYLQLRKYKTKLSELMDKLQIFYNKHADIYVMPDEALQPDQFCVALYEVSSDCIEWHRAQISKVVEDGRVAVTLVDYGTATKVSKDCLRFLHRDFGFLPVQGISGHLANIRPPNSESRWPMESNQKFLELIFDKDLVAGVVDVLYEKCWMSVSLSSTQDDETEVHINDVLVSDGLAVFEKAPVDPEKQKSASANQQKGPNKTRESDDVFPIDENDRVPAETAFSKKPVEPEFPEPVEDEDEKETRTMALNLLANHPYLRTMVAVTPDLALNIALNLAKDIKSKRFQSKINIPTDSNETAPKIISDESSVNFKMADLKITKEETDPEEDPLVFIKKEQVGNKPMHILTCDEKYVFVDEMIKSFTPFSGQEIVDRLLSAKKISYSYVIITRATHGFIFKVIENFTINGVKSHRTPLKDRLQLLPLNSVIGFLRTVAWIDSSLVLTLHELVTKYLSN